jgi:hypothetical protein
MWRIGRAPNSTPVYSYILQDATSHSSFISGNCSTCFGWYFHPSSGVHTTVSTASGICHTVTICGYRGRVETGLSVLWVAYANITASCVIGTSILIPESKCYVAFTVINIIVEGLYESHFLYKLTDIYLQRLCYLLIKEKSDSIFYSRNSIKRQILTLRLELRFTRSLVSSIDFIINLFLI